MFILDLDIKLNNMKKLLAIVLVLIFGLITNNLLAQKVKKTEEIKIKTTAQCDMCKQRLEKVMAYEKGIVSANLDVNTQVFTVKYKIAKTDPEKIRTTISNTGYDADSIKANQAAHDKLPKCCQKGGHKK